MAIPIRKYPSSHLSERFVPGIGTIINEPPGLDWVHPNIAVFDTGVIGLGLIALSPIKKGESVILFGGKLMSWDEVLSLPEDMQDIPYQVADDIFFGIANRNEIGVGERINHSCDPNTGFESEMRLTAIRDILPGEAVTMDYATCTSKEGYKLICQCGSSKCRGIVTGDDWKLPSIQENLGEYFQPYLRQKISEEKEKYRDNGKTTSLLFRPAASLDRENPTAKTKGSEQLNLESGEINEFVAYKTLRPLESKTLFGKWVEIAIRVLKFISTAYRLHWTAAPSGAIAAVVSTVGAATIMMFIGPVMHELLADSAAILTNAIIGPLLAYLLYLTSYYFGMFLSEQKQLRDQSGRFNSAKLQSWLRVVKYDYLAHVPSDIYLITLAGIMQATFESNGMSIFLAVLLSQFVDDLVTFLKEPAIWTGAKEVVAWERRSDKTVWALITKTVRR